ncbi:hypothetical protein K438DRAFT_1772749 [Mycena galopus ATCC 62051]|nr:hypothetical protein K438DRAFT_1772749 [Mycena galopus ATCC 62051]
MHAKFASLTVLLSVIFTSQMVGAVPTDIDCSHIDCPATRCPLGETAEVRPGACCPGCVKCGGICPEFILRWSVFILPDTCEVLTQLIALRVPCLGGCPGNVAPQAASRYQRTESAYRFTDNWCPCAL